MSKQTDSEKARNTKNAAAAVVLSGVMAATGAAGSAVTVDAATAVNPDDQAASGNHSGMVQKTQTVNLKPANKNEAEKAYQDAAAVAEKQKTAKNQADQKLAEAQKAYDAVKNNTVTYSYGTDPAPYYQKAKDALARIQSDTAAKKQQAETAQKQAESEKQKAEAELQEKQAAHDQAVKERDQAKNEYDAVVKANSDIEAKIQEDSKKVEDAQKEQQDAAKALQSAETALKEASDRVNAVDAELKKVQADAKNAEDALSNAKTNLQQKQDAYNAAKVELDKAEKDSAYTVKKEAVTTAESALADAKAKQEEAETAKKQADEAVTEAQNKLKQANDVKDQYAALQKQAVQAKADADLAAQTVKDKEKAVADAQKKADAQKTQIDELKSELESKKAAVTSAENDLKTAQSALDAANQKWEQAKTDANAALTQAQNVYDNAGRSFMDSKARSGCKSSDVLNFIKNDQDKVVIDSSGKTEDKTMCSLYETNHIEIDKDIDSVYAIDNLKKELDFVDECNRLRNQEGLTTPLTFNYNLMALSAYSTAISEYTKFHSLFRDPTVYKSISGCENLAWGYEKPFEAWYGEEKPYYLKDPNSSQAGHYRNIIDRDNKTIVVTYINDGKASGMLTSSNESEVGVSTDQVRNDLAAYVSSAENNLTKAKEQADNLDTAPEEVNQAQSAVNEKQKALDEAKKAVSDIQEQIDAAQSAYDAQTAEVAKLTQEKEDAQKDAQQKTEALTKANEDADSFKSQNPDMEDAIQKAEQGVKTAEEEQKKAESAVNDANAQVEKCNETLTQAKKALDEANKTIDELKSKADAAKAEADAAQNAVTKEENAEKNAKQAVTDSQEKLNEANSAKEKADKTAQKAKETSDAADQKLKAAQDELDKDTAVQQQIQDAKKKSDAAEQAVEKAQAALTEAECSVQKAKETLKKAGDTVQTAAEEAEAAKKMNLNNPESYKQKPEIVQAMKQYEAAKKSSGYYTVPADTTAQKKALEDAQAQQKQAEQNLNKALADLAIAKTNLANLKEVSEKLSLKKSAITSIKSMKLRSKKRVNKNKRKVVIRWKKVKDAKRYKLYTRYGKKGKYKLAATTSKLSYKVVVKKGTVVYAKVRALNGKTIGKMSSPKRVKA